MIRAYKRTNLYRAMQRHLSDVSKSPADKLTKPNLFFDIGANLGIYSLLAKEFGVTTILFEPEKRHFDFLDRNQLLFDKVFQYALTNYDGKKSFFVGNEKNLGGSSLIESTNSWESSGYEKTIEVPVLRFDSLVTMYPNELNRQAFFKIDVEGNELETIEGMHGYLLEGHFSPIWCEVRGPQSDRNPDSYIKVIKCLSQYGYRSFKPKQNGFELFSPEKHEVHQVFDLLFLKKRCES